MTRKRQLHPEEKTLWQQVAKTTVPLHSVRTRNVQHAETTSSKVYEGPRFTVQPFQVGQRSSENSVKALPAVTQTNPNNGSIRMDQKAFGRMKKGKLGPEARIDLHGMTLDQAHPELAQFIVTSYAQGLRLVLVITGKGHQYDPYNPVPLRRGILKRQVPLWLRMPPINTLILQTSEAHTRHGGRGAYYVYLARRR
jgi:DNA-nicking Smr family endonuclease